MSLMCIVYWFFSFLTWPLLVPFRAWSRVCVMRAVYDVHREFRDGTRKAGDTIEATRNEDRIISSMWVWIAIVALAVWK